MVGDEGLDNKRYVWDSPWRHPWSSTTNQAFFGLPEASYDWQIGRPVSDAELNEAFRVASQHSKPGTGPQSMQDYLTSLKSPFRQYDGGTWFRPDLATGDYEGLIADEGGQHGLSTLKGFLTSPATKLMLAAVGGQALGAGMGAAGFGGMGSSAFPTFLGDLGAGALGAGAGLGSAGNYLQFADQPGFTQLLSNTEGLPGATGDWFNLDYFNQFPEVPGDYGFLESLGAGAAGGATAQQLADITAADPTAIGAEGTANMLKSVGITDAAVPQTATQWLAKAIKDSFGIDMSPGALSALGTGAGLLGGYLSANKAADRSQQAVDRALGITQQELAMRQPFAQTATNWLTNPASYWATDPAQEIARQTARVISGGRHENLFDNPTGQSLVMQSLAPQWLNSITQMANLGLQNTAPLANVVGNLGLTAAQAQGMPGAVLGAGVSDIFGAGSNQMQNTNSILRQILMAQNPNAGYRLG